MSDVGYNLHFFFILLFTPNDIMQVLLCLMVRLIAVCGFYHNSTSIRKLKYIEPSTVYCAESVLRDNISKKKKIVIDDDDWWIIQTMLFEINFSDGGVHKSSSTTCRISIAYI